MPKTAVCNLAIALDRVGYPPSTLGPEQPSPACPPHSVVQHNKVYVQHAAAARKAEANGLHSIRDLSV
eukprot:6177442-Pleurochrysis_carterae.AAC.1